MRAHVAPLLAALAAAPAGAAVNADNTVVTYPIAGASAADLRAQMNALGPAEGGKRFDGHTKWNVRWRYDYRSAAGSCAIARVTVDVSTTVRLPEWRDEAAAPADLRARWQRYLAALTAHENGHRDHGLAAAREVDATLAVLPPQPTCDALGAAANARGQDILRRYNERDLEYDRSSDHGRRQGATWP